MRKLLFFILLLFISLKGYTAIFTVTNANSAGAGSLNQAITDANALVGLDTINFNASYNIILTAALPAVTSPVFVNGPYIGGPQIEINGNTNSIAGPGILLAGSANGSTIKGLNIHGMGGQGILISASNCTVIGCYIGTNFAGTAAVANNFAGIEIAANLNAIKIGGSTPDSSNVISGNGQTGINIAPNCTNIKISGNKIGTNALGTAAVANAQTAIVANTVTNILIGGGLNERNIISGNSGHGTLLIACVNARISNNYIGTNATGTASLPNAFSGIQLNNTPARIGGFSSDSSNVISGNSQIGIDVINTSGVTILGNHIGLGANGITQLGNGVHGIQLDGCSNVTIGGPTIGHRNLISDNRSHGILITNGISVSVMGNYIGTDITGTLDRGNTSHGIQLQGSATNMVIGGRRFIEGNIISGNGGFGINFEDGGTGKLAANGTIIKGNLMGTDITTTLDLGNFLACIALKSDNCIIGDTTSGEGNVFAGSDLFCGLLIANGNGNIVQGNYVGVGLNGTSPIGNTQDGILVAVENVGQTANNNIIRYNTIAYNGRHGVNIGKPLNTHITNNERGNIIRFNQIYCNTGLGISLNLTNAADQGNNGQPAPQIDFFLSTSSVIRGVTTPGLAGMKIDLYHIEDCPNCDINPQGKRWIDSVVVSGTGAWSYDYFSNFGSFLPGDVVATVTDLSGNTSQFSTCCLASTGSSLVSSTNPVCPNTSFSITYSNGQRGDSLMLQSTIDPTLLSGWTNIRSVRLTDPITISNLTITDTSYFRFITFSQGAYAVAACKDSSSVLQVNLAQTATSGVATISDDTICAGTSVQLTLTGGTGNIQWERSISGGNFAPISGATSAVATNTPSTQNPIVYRARNSLSSCSDALSNTVSVFVSNASAGALSSDGRICKGLPVTITLSGASGTLLWRDSLIGGNWQTTASSGNSLEFTSDTTRYIQVIAVDITGNCRDTSALFTITPTLCSEAQPILLPNAITANNDGENDVFFIHNIWLYPDNTLYIYNRWGSKVYESTGYINEWDGTRNGEKLPEGTYYYVLTLGSDINGNLNPDNQYTGYVSIIR